MWPRPSRADTTVTIDARQGGRVQFRTHRAAEEQGVFAEQLAWHRDVQFGVGDTAVMGQTLPPEPDHYLIPGGGRP